jgi:hypothetical protein
MSKTKIEKIFPEYIRLDGGTQPRAKIDQAVCDEYGERMKAGDKFPSIDVFFDGENYWLTDGFHRLHAYVMALPGEAIECNVFQGTLADAQWYSYSVNKAHGFRRTNRDKDRALQAALAHPNGASQSDRQIAEHVGVSHEMVRTHRPKEVSDCQPLTVRPRTGRDGRTINTANIGCKARKRSSGKPSRRMAGKVHNPTRAPVPVAKMTSLDMPHDPVMGARTLIEVFDADYLRAVVEEISRYLKGLQK